MGLITLQQVLSAVAAEGRPLAVSTFRTYVAKGHAPQPAAREGRTPMWDEDAVRAWAKMQLGDLQHRQQLQRWEADHPPTADVAPVELATAFHLVELDPRLPDYLAVSAAAEQLQIRRLELHEAAERAEAVLPTTTGADGSDAVQNNQFEAPRQGLVAGVLQRWRTARSERERVSEIDRVRHVALALREAEVAAEHDLAVCRAWVVQNLRWAEGERQRQLDLIAQAEMDEDARDRALDGSEGTLFESAVDFVLDNPRRLTRASDSMDDLWIQPAEVFDRIRDGRADDLALVLAGADFGYSWRDDSTDRQERWGRGRPGTWRVSWSAGTGELYAENRTVDRVWLIGSLPETSMSLVMDWLFPFELRQDERNSLALVFRAFDEQRGTEFHALRHHLPSGFSFI